MCVNIRCMLIAPAKILEREESISPSSFYGELLTISHTFYSAIYPVNKEMRTWSRCEIASYCFSVWCESSSLLHLKPGWRGDYLMCILSTKITELWGILLCQ